MEQKVQLKYLPSLSFCSEKLIIYFYRREAGIFIIGRVGLLQLQFVAPHLQGVLGGPEGALPSQRPWPLLQVVNYLTTEDDLSPPSIENGPYPQRIME